ncbi:dihydrofolate reductase [Leifsonia sp. Leaf264]|uniref:dihydrofolate reductase n=1 Tax=Leifsonia sp. Leaf264 TaxID=1736314 RepID=UPI0006F9CF3E|nr:dihydrofolate reductase [Leifsonia sp. Leaf264]KQO98783.1 hypothetical protein ASF30_12025 [Leifsonia sp. Leaf264]
MTAINLIWAQSVAGVIGVDGRLPWHLPEDLARFKELTAGHAVVMGRKTWESLPAKRRPLPGRRNIVLTKTVDYEAPGALVAQSKIGGILAAHGDDVWVIGGAEIYQQYKWHADRIEVTEIDVTVDGDAFAPEIPPHFKADRGEWLISAGGLRYRFVTYTRAEAGYPGVMPFHQQ